MNIRQTLGRAVAIAAAATGLAALGLTGVASASTTPAFSEGFHVCSIRAFDGHFLSAIDGGGRTTDVIETNRTKQSTWETFTLVPANDGAFPLHFGIQTHNGNFLTAVGGGGRTTDVIHSNATQLQAWEKFTLVPVGFNYYAIQTIDGHYLTAVNSGGIGSAFEAIHSNATQIQAWEEFAFSCS